MDTAQIASIAVVIQQQVAADEVGVLALDVEADEESGVGETARKTKVRADRTGIGESELAALHLAH